MRGRRLVAACAAGTLAAAAGAAWGIAAWEARVPAPPLTQQSGIPFSELALRDEQLRVWRQALDADPQSALVQGQLAALHAQRAREGGSWEDYLTAERYARRSLARRTDRNGATAATLVSVLIAQHRFAEAYVEARALAAREPDVPQYRAIAGEVAMELGEYDSARAMFETVWGERRHLSVAPRLARWLELNGQVRVARRLLRDAGEEAQHRGDVAREAKAWFALRLAELEMRDGRPRAARYALEAGLALEPDDPRLSAAMARLAAAREEWERATQWGERAIALRLDPVTLALLGDAYAASGDSARSGEYARALQVVASAPGAAPHRAWSLYRLDHDIELAEVLRQAQHELEGRRDVYGYDVVAWALYRNGRVAEAAEMMRRALTLGTVDPMLARHAAAIAAARAGLIDRATEE